MLWNLRAPMEKVGFGHDHPQHNYCKQKNYNFHIMFDRNNAFKEDEGAWKGEGDGKVVNNQPQRVMMDGQHMMASGYIGK